MWFAAVLAAAALVAAPPPPERDCPTHVEGDEPGLVRHPSDLVTRPVIFHGLRGGPATDPSPTEDGDAVIKAGVSVRAGRPVTVRIARRDRGTVALDYDMEDWRERRRTVAAGNGQPAVRFRPCPPETPRFVDGRPVGEWTGYSGGFLVARPRCVTLEVRRDGARRWIRRRVGLGAPCPPTTRR